VPQERNNGPRKFSTAYEMFILVLTLLSFAIMVMLLLPLSEATHQLLLVYDNVICVVFLGDFLVRLTRATTATQYFIRERGWLDLVGSIPAFGVFKYSAPFRLARLLRLVRNLRLVGTPQKRRAVMREALAHRGEYAGFVAITVAAIVLVVASISVLGFESQSANANIVTGGEALWWAIVTMTTVGYGDFFPVTMGGRITATFVMFMGVGIIGALASVLASFLIAPAQPEPGDSSQSSEADSRELHDELQGIRAELEALRNTLGPRSANR
jgi:voltage-gated potassium channel